MGKRGGIMKLDFNSELPIYLQITAEMEDAIFTGAFPEETQAPSTTEISASMQINPATVLKGMNLLVDEGLLYKKRGLGLFVKEGAVERIRKKRQQQFYEKYVVTLVKEARKLKLTREEVMEWMERGFAQ
jgi:DNA-binding transcriptional regulator YhcF (GntR family)